MLRVTRHRSPDAEVRARAAKLLAKIEHDVLTRPTLVTLDVRDQTIGDAIKMLGEKNHFELSGELDDVREKLMIFNSIIMHSMQHHISRSPARST
jgi:hypothetical protein